MSTVGDYLRLLLVVVPFIAAPGPGNLMCAATGARFGTRRAIPFVAGLEIMVFVPALVVGLGVGEALERADAALGWLQVAGSLFILFLAWRILRDPPVPVGALDGGGRTDGRAPSFGDAVLLQALNAKGAVVLVVIFAEFADESGQTLLNALRITLVITAVSLVFHVLWMQMGEWLARRFTSTRALRIQSWIYAAMLASVAIWLLIA